MNRLASVVVAVLLTMAAACATDWPRFRGPGGLGLGESTVPLEWSDEKNLLWKTPLPGPGSSSPVIHGDDVFVTCYSGYGVPGDRGGEPAKLVRHLLCIDRLTGAEKWRRDVAGDLPEDAYEGFLTEHGYASSTPVVDADAVYAFFGKSGVIAFECGSMVTTRLPCPIWQASSRPLRSKQRPLVFPEGSSQVSTSNGPSVAGRSCGTIQRWIFPAGMSLKRMLPSASATGPSVN